MEITMKGLNFAELRVWIAGNGNAGSVWHVGRQWVRVGPNTGKVLDAGMVTACAGRSLGGPYGYAKDVAPPPGDPVCKRCAAKYLA